jgi:hypothetical protein
MSTQSKEFFGKEKSQKLGREEAIDQSVSAILYIVLLAG